MQQLHRARQLATAAVAFPGFWLGGAAFALVLPVVHAMSRDRHAATERSQRALRAGFRLFMDALRLGGVIDFDWRAYSDDLPAGPAVLVANHPTLIDVVALLACYERTCVVA